MVDAEVEPTLEAEAQAASRNGGPPPGIPIKPMAQRVLDPDQVVAAAKPQPCVRCLVVRGAVLLIMAGVLVYILVQERRKAAKPQEVAK